MNEKFKNLIKLNKLNKNKFNFKVSAIVKKLKF